MSHTADPRPAVLPTVDGAALGLTLEHTYATELVGLHAPWPPVPAPQPRLLALNTELAAELGLNAQALAGESGLAVLSGQALPEGAQPIAQAYAGHQFGGFSPQLGDGRALLLGEVIDTRGQRRDIAFKGSGRTPFSRGGDGKAAVGPVLREYLMGEAMQALGIPTTRALAAVATGEAVYRERSLPGALLVRVASSHLRVGTFQFFAARQDTGKLQRLTDYAIARHDPALAGQEGRYLRFFQGVAHRQAALIAQWMGVGFIHGVMNTDNMTLSGETIDYGPCAFMDAYDPATVFSSIDHHGRYAYANQPLIARWNLARLAEALLPLIDADTDRAIAQVSETVDAFEGLYQAQWLRQMRGKLGLTGEGERGGERAGVEADDTALAEEFLALLHQHRVDFTQAFRALAEAAETGPDGAAALLGLLPIQGQAAMRSWLERWRPQALGAGRTPAQVGAALRAVNPVYIPRNHLVEEALEAATEREDLTAFNALLAVLKSPFDEQPGKERYAQPGHPDLQAGYRTFCGT
jgi:serine/tyrosine/threonine adenylyltransferase